MIIKKSLRQREIKTNMAEGKGEVEITHIIEKDDLPTQCRLYAEIIIKPGDSIGNHQHIAEQEIFYFLQGNGLVTDNGEAFEVGPGDVMVTPDKGFHSVKNIGKEDLVFMGLILKTME